MGCGVLAGLVGLVAPFVVAADWFSRRFVSPDCEELLRVCLYEHPLSGTCCLRPSVLGEGSKPISLQGCMGFYPCVVGELLVHGCEDVTEL